MAFFEWKDRMSVGHEMIDHDHQKLVHYVNQMHEAMIAGHGKEIVGPILNNLIAYTKDHFGREELIWRSGHYVDFARHKKEHTDLIKTVTELQAKYAVGTVALSVDVMSFLRDWLKNHIMKSDREAADAIAAMARAKAASHAAGPRPAGLGTAVPK
jgi:hemerythrin-like metal-binding protein